MSKFLYIRSGLLSDTRIPIRIAAVLLAVGICQILSLGNSTIFAENKVAELKRDTPVDFNKEILPMLRQNCLACHNRKDAENDLILETVPAIHKGGAEGPAVVPGKPDESMLFLLSVHRDEPVMPPADNEVQAKPLDEQQLALLRLWIQQGAKEGTSASNVVKLEKLPPGINPVFALSVSPDGRYLAAGRANQVSIYSVAGKNEVTRLTDQALIDSGIYENPGVAHMDVVQSVAFSPDNQTVATGGYKTVKLWRHENRIEVKQEIALPDNFSSVTISNDSKLLAIGFQDGSIELRDAASNQVKTKLTGHTGIVSSLEFSSDSARLYSGSADKSLRVWNLADNKLADNKEVAQLILEWPIHDICLAAAESMIAIAGENNVIDCYEVAKLQPAKQPEPAKPADGEKKEESKPEEGEKKAEKKEEPLKPAKQLAGSSQPVTRLMRFAADGTTLLSAGRDGVVRQWDVNGARMIRQFNHGQPIADITVSEDLQTIASIAQSQSIKIWNAATGQMPFELKGDIRSNLEINRRTLEVSLRQRRTDLAKKDVEEMKKRKTSEEANVKKAQGELTTAQADLKTKTDAEKVAKEKRDKADDDLKAKREELVAEEKKVADADVEIAALDKMITEKQEAIKQMTAATAQLTQADAAAKQKLTGVENQLKQKPDDEELKKQVAAAKAEVDGLQKQLADAAEKSKVMATDLASVTKSRTDKNNEKTKSTQKVQQLKQMVTQQENNFNNLDKQLETAVQQREASQRVVKNHERTIQRSNEATANATKRIPELEAIVKTEEAQKVESDKAVQQARDEANALNKQFVSIAFYDNDLLVASNENGRMTVWNAKTGLSLNSFDVALCEHLTRTSDSQLLALQKSKKRLVRLSMLDQWNLVRKIGNIDSDEFADRVTALEFSPDGKRLASGGGEPTRGGELKIWNVEDGKLIREIPDAHSDTILGVTFSPDGQKIASSSTDRFVKTFEVETGKHLNTFEGHTHHVMSVAWSADSRSLATAGADKVIKIWDAETGEQKQTIAGYKKEVAGIRFVGVQNQVLAGSGDGSVRLDDAANSRQIRRYNGFNEFVHCVGASADGKLFAAGGNDGAVRIWQEDGKIIAEFKQPDPATEK